MATIGQKHRISIQTARQTVFNALTTVEGLEGWYAAAIEVKTENGGVYAGSEIHFDFSDHEPAFRWKVIEATLDSIRWQCEAGPGQAKGTTAIVQLSEKDGKTTVSLDHEGAQDFDSERLKTCNTYWGSLMAHLKDYAETGEPSPAFR